jgi:hypothetical protein
LFIIFLAHQSNKPDWLRDYYKFIHSYLQFSACPGLPQLSASMCLSMSLFAEDEKCVLVVVMMVEVVGNGIWSMKHHLLNGAKGILEHFSRLSLALILKLC